MTEIDDTRREDIGVYMKRRIHYLSLPFDCWQT